MLLLQFLLHKNLARTALFVIFFFFLMPHQNNNNALNIDENDWVRYHKKKKIVAQELKKILNFNDRNTMVQSIHFLFLKKKN